MRYNQKLEEAGFWPCRRWIRWPEKLCMTLHVAYHLPFFVLLSLLVLVTRGRLRPTPLVLGLTPVLFTALLYSALIYSLWGFRR